MSPTINDAKKRLKRLIDIARIDLYKPIQVAEVLYNSRQSRDVRADELETYRNRSIAWRDSVTLRLTGKRCTSSARYQHDTWNDNAIPPSLLRLLDRENKRTNGAVERFIYLSYAERQGDIENAITHLYDAKPATFQLSEFLQLFTERPGLRRSIDKVYEIVAYTLFDVITNTINATVTLSVPVGSRSILREFADLTKVLFGIDETNLTWTQKARIYRVGVTNAADRGLDMWANFGPVVQVKHISLIPRVAQGIVDQVESDHIVIVCKDADEQVLTTILDQIGWGRRVRGLIRESDLITWYEKCLRGRFRRKLASPLLTGLINGFGNEFPQAETLIGFLRERGYDTMQPPDFWELQ